MSRAVLLFTLVAASASAQVAPPRAPTGGERAILVAGALAGGAVGLATGPFSPLVAGAATLGTSAALGLGPTGGGVLLDMAAGTVVAVAVWRGGRWAVTTFGDPGPDSFSFEIGWAVTGLVVGGAAIGAVHGARLAWLRAPGGVEVAPVVLAGPGGASGSGLSLTVSL